MEHSVRSIRPFIGAKDYQLSRAFYRYLGFEEGVLSPNMSVFKTGNFAFYVQDYYAKEWIENSMIFLEVEDVDSYWSQLLALKIEEKFPGSKVIPIQDNDWGRECFLHDPSGILWHFGEFNAS